MAVRLQFEDKDEYGNLYTEHHHSNESNVQARSDKWTAKFSFIFLPNGWDSLLVQRIQFF